MREHTDCRSSHVPKLEGGSPHLPKTSFPTCPHLHPGVNPGMILFMGIFWWLGLERDECKLAPSAVSHQKPSLGSGEYCEKWTWVPSHPSFRQSLRPACARHLTGRRWSSWGAAHRGACGAPESPWRSRSSCSSLAPRFHRSRHRVSSAEFLLGERFHPIRGTSGSHEKGPLYLGI